MKEKKIYINSRLWAFPLITTTVTANTSSRSYIIKIHVFNFTFTKIMLRWDRECKRANHINRIEVTKMEWTEWNENKIKKNPTLSETVKLKEKKNKLYTNGLYRPCSLYNFFFRCLLFSFFPNKKNVYLYVCMYVAHFLLLSSTSLTVSDISVFFSSLL